MKSDTYREYNENKKEPLSDSFIISYNRCCSFFAKGSFADAEVPEDASQHFVGGDAACDGTYVENRFPDVLTDQVCRDRGG